MRARRFLAYTHSQLSGVYGDSDRYDIALRHGRRAVDIIEKIPSVDPVYRVDLLEALGRLGVAESETGSCSTGCATLERSMAIGHELDTQAAQMPPDLNARFRAVKSNVQSAATRSRSVLNR